MSNELPWAADWLYTKLIGGTVASRVYDTIAPAGAVSPYTIVQVQSPGVDLMVVGGARVWASPLFLVKAVGNVSSWGSLKAVANEIDSRLHDATGTTTDGRILSCVRESPFSLVEVTDGKQYRHLGGFYRILVQPIGA